MQIGTKDGTKLELAASNFHISHSIHASADIYVGAETTTPATQIEPEVLKESRLPHKRRQASTDIYRGIESTTPATQSEPEVLKGSTRTEWIVQMLSTAGWHYSVCSFRVCRLDGALKILGILTFG